MTDVGQNLTDVLGKVNEACRRAARPLDSVQLIAVSKTFPAAAIRQAMEAGQLHFGESKVQEASPKIACLPNSLHWHFIGRVQRNKVRKLLPDFAIIHAVDSSQLATAIDDLARELGLFPKAFIQVNIGRESSKGGFDPHVLESNIEEFLTLKRLEIVGLMCIPPIGPNAGAARPWFAALRELRDAIESNLGVRLPGLSMGMSSDFETAIEEGATHVRVGSAIFGKRAYRVDGELG